LQPSPSEFLPDAVVLAGGGAHRLGGVDKTALEVGGVPLLDRVLLALPPCGRVVVVGAERATGVPVAWTREEPPGSGPVSAIATGLEMVSADLVLVIAGDMPFLSPPVLERLLSSVSGDGALLLDDGGREQYLCSAWRTAPLRQAVRGVTRVKDVVARLTYARVSWPADVVAPWTDCDTPDDLRAARERA